MESLESPGGGAAVPAVALRGASDKHAESDQCGSVVEMEVDRHATLLRAATLLAVAVHPRVASLHHPPHAGMGHGGMPLQAIRRTWRRMVRLRIGGSRCARSRSHGPGPARRARTRRGPVPDDGGSPAPQCSVSPPVESWRSHVGFGTRSSTARSFALLLAPASAPPACCPSRFRARNSSLAPWSRSSTRMRCAGRMRCAMQARTSQATARARSESHRSWLARSMGSR